MIKILAGLLLLVCVVRIVGPAATSMQDAYTFFNLPMQEEDTKAQEENSKVKAEQELVIYQSGFTISTSACQLTKHPFKSLQFIPTAFQEPLCPPPNSSHS